MNREQLPEGVPEAELIEIYVTSAKIHLSTMATVLNPADPPGPATDWLTLQRSGHSLKGASSQFGFLEPAQVAARIETLAARLQKAPETATPAFRSALLEALDELALLVRELEDGRPNHDPSALCRKLQEMER